MTRIFGYSLPCTCLVPFGDLFNHNNYASTHYIVNYKFEKDELNKAENYKIKKHKLNLKIFSEEFFDENVDYSYKNKRLEYVKRH